jgi:hypothetical protein
MYSHLRTERLTRSLRALLLRRRAAGSSYISHASVEKLSWTLNQLFVVLDLHLREAETAAAEGGAPRVATAPGCGRSCTK